MRRFQDLIMAHKKFSFGLWIVVLAAVVAGAQWQLTGGGSVLTQVLGASQSVPPQPAITSGPAEGSTTSATSATFTYSDTQNGVQFQCQLDGAPFSSCAKGGVTYTGLVAGSHTFRVEAQQGNGPLSAPATRSWSVVIPPPPPPTPAISSHPASSTIEPDATFAFTDSRAAVTFQCQLDSGSFASCASPVLYESLAAGGHTFSVRAIDGSGMSGSASFSWTITSASFGISGNLTATLAPGLSAPLNLMFTNPYNNAHGIVVTSVVITVQHATVKNVAGHPLNPACDGPTNVVVSRAFTGPVTVPRGTAPQSLSDLHVPDAQWPLILMANLATNQDPCKSTTFNFSYTGTATK